MLLIFTVQERYIVFKTTLLLKACYYLRQTDYLEIGRFQLTHGKPWGNLNLSSSEKYGSINTKAFPGDLGITMPFEMYR
jgi:hypothetical protein